MKIYLKILFLIFILFACSKNPTGLQNTNFNGESYPVGPLRIINSKIISETWYQLNTNDILERTEYEYFNSGLLKSKTRSLPDIISNTVNEYFYNNESKLIQEIVSCEGLYSDTIYFTYNSANMLTQKETVHSTPNFILRDTVFYNYDLEGNLSEWYRKDPYSQYSDIYTEKYEYSNNLLINKYSYMNDNLLRSYEYKYYNNIKTKELVYVNSGLLEHRAIYYYQDRLLKHVKGYISDEPECSDQIIYEYNDRYELIVKNVFVPIYSSYTNHEIHYEY
jgi:hypothetical protein